MNFLTALLPLFTGSLQGIKDWFSYKKELAKADQDYKLAVLQAQAEQAKQQAISESANLSTRMNATSQSFRQTTFWLVWVPIALTVLFPKRAVEMWSNLKLIPEFWYWLLGSMYTAIWAIPKGYEAVDRYIDKRRDYTLEKLKIDRQAYFNAKRKVEGSLSQQQVDKDNKILDELDNV